jgi:hypothetical protein
MDCRRLCSKAIHLSLSQSEREIQSPETKEIKKFFQENEKNSKQSF